MVYSRQELKGIVFASSQVVALIDTLTNYVLSANERVHKRIYIQMGKWKRCNVTSGIKMHRCPDPAHLSVISTQLLATRIV